MCVYESSHLHIHLLTKKILILLAKWGHFWGNGASLQGPTTSVEVLRVRIWL